MTSLLNISAWGYSAVPVLKYLLPVGWGLGEGQPFPAQRTTG